jgi:hypothetical protein
VHDGGRQRGGGVLRATAVWFKRLRAVIELPCLERQSRMIPKKRSRKTIGSSGLRAMQVGWGGCNSVCGTVCWTRVGVRVQGHQLLLFDDRWPLPSRQLAARGRSEELREFMLLHGRHGLKTRMV